MLQECSETSRSLKATTVIRQQIDWQELELLQQDLISQVTKNPSNFFLLVSEPSPTFTFGRNASQDDLLWSPSQLKENGVGLAQVSRGGKWTYHGPGQIVIYPIVNLKSIGFSTKEARRFVETLRQAVLECCQAWQLPAQTGENPFGIYLEEKKLVSFGLSFQNGISSHGLSVCFSPQQKFFSGIRPCGQSESVFTSLQEHLPSLTWHDAATSLTDSIKKSFKIS
jgi:lipoyl(octanoyl) transferase